MLGGLGPVDMIGGCFVGIAASFLVVLIRKYNLPKWVCGIPVILVPGTIVPIWLSVINSLPYGLLVASLCIGQIIPSITGVILIKALSKVYAKQNIR